MNVIYRHPNPKRPNPIFRVIRLLLGFALIYAIVEAIGWVNIQGFFYMLAEPWFGLAEKHQWNISGILTHPIALILGAIILFRMIAGRR